MRPLLCLLCDCIMQRSSASSLARRFDAIRKTVWMRPDEINIKKKGAKAKVVHTNLHSFTSNCDQFGRSHIHGRQGIGTTAVTSLLYNVCHHLIEINRSMPPNT